ncbi:hypothetical protein B9G55_22585 [Saccharibacillus sp. O16]|nr:hypothetical protein B9G55_22585 [Saccharibacillus sp. O16]
MYRKLKIFGIFLLLLGPLVMLSPTERTLACSCMIPPSAQAAKAEAAAVFLGTVTDVKEVSRRTEGYYEAQVNVQESWKGVTQANVKVYSDFSSCSFDFEVGKSYLFYAYNVQQRLDVINCGRSRELSTEYPETAADIEELGAGTRFVSKQAVGEKSNSEERRAPTWAGWAAGGSLVILVISGLLTQKATRR